SIGLANAVNTVPDKSAPLLYQASISKMYESHSSKGTKYYVRVAPWGPLIYPEDVDVKMSTYKAFRVGDLACFGLHPGFLQAPWYALTDCPARQNP
ncbi:MAG TPA: hypothetical protein VE195_02010, partial [Acidobacteriaceae bacterium]|nr:hypothetical protein [Acidobacteriaceae bacterium]